MKIFNMQSLKDCVPDITGSVATVLKIEGFFFLTKLCYYY